MDHVSERQLTALADGTLDAKERADVEAHIASCQDCAARADSTESTTHVGFATMPKDTVAPKVVDVADRFERGANLGRYLVLDVLGAGGMGVVYSAFDPELDRRVAVKLLQAHAATNDLQGGHAWLLREAQALARLSHPNVISVFDTGTLPGERVFLAMELVDGQTLRQWLKEQKRAWPEALAVLVAAGRGLAAAHAAGLVHRDFKPDNVLVGKDGRVKVMDFGLARAARLAQPEAALDAEGEAELLAQLSPLTADLTQPGRILGTPAYMAPEVLKGAATAQSDQFAFGVALYEAVYGSRPFPRERILAKEGAPLVPKEPPPDTTVPARVKRAIWRAIAPKPEDRFPSMDALLAELTVDEAPRRSLISMAAVAVVVVAAVAIPVALSSSRVSPCKDSAHKLDGIWDGARKDALRAAFEKTQKPFAASAAASVTKSLDAYAADWTNASTEACEATRVKKEQSEAVLSLREACLGERLYELDGLVSLFAKADAPLVEKSDRAVFALEPIKRCANIVALQAPGQPPQDAESKPKLQELAHKLAAAKAALDAGKLDDVLKASDEAVTLARVVHFPSAEAEALLRRGTALNQSGKAQDASTALADAVFAAVRGKRDDVAAEASLIAAQNAADALSKDGEARLWLGLAEATAAKVGIDRNLALHMLEVEGVVAGARGELSKGAELHEQALALATEVYGADNPALWRSEQLLASSLAKAGEYAKAIPHFEKALAWKEQLGGDEHPDTALILSNLGASYDHVGDGEKARDALVKALAIREKNFGPESPKLVATLNNLADLLRQQGKTDDALHDAQRGYDIASKVPGPKHPLTHTVATTLAEVLATAGKGTEARALLDDVIKIEETASSPMLATSLASRAALDVTEKKWSAADADAGKAIALFEKSAGADAADLLKPLTSLAQTRIAQGHVELAKPLLTRAIAIGKKAQAKDADLAPAEAALQATVASK